MSGGWDAADWLARFQALGGGWVQQGERVTFSWPANGQELLIREHWRAIEHDEGRRADVRRLVASGDGER